MKTPAFPEHFSNAEKITWSYDGPDGSDRKFRHEFFSFLPNKVADSIAKTYEKLYLKESRQKANLFITNLKDYLTPKTTNIALSINGAEIYAQEIISELRIIQPLNNDPNELLEKLSKRAEIHNVSPPKPNKNITIEGAIKRLFDKNWWIRKLKKFHREQFEIGLIQAGLVHKKAAIYVSDQTLKTHLDIKDRNTRILESLYVYNETNESEHSLLELSKHSQANPYNRRCELMVRLSGTEKLSHDLEHAALFVTLTCPSRMHPRYASSGDPNPNFDGTTPRQANDYLNKLWSQIRAKFKRDKIHCYGLRVAEPQHDATPHWHFLLFTATNNLEIVKRIFFEYALNDSKHEKGANKHRVTFELIDPKKGTATGYIAKYISKNIDGAHLNKDLHNNDAKTASQRVAAWASVFGIRQFQFFGTAPVNLWREIRRLSSTPEGIISEAFSAADKGDWHQFLNILGGIETERKKLPLKTFSVWNDKLGKYGEPLGERVLGVTDGKNEAISRDGVWSIRKGKINAIYKSVCMASAMHTDL